MAAYVQQRVTKSVFIYFFIITSIWGRFPFGQIVFKGLKPPTRIYTELEKSPSTKLKTMILNYYIMMFIDRFQWDIDVINFSGTLNFWRDTQLQRYPQIIGCHNLFKPSPGLGGKYIYFFVAAVSLFHPAGVVTSYHGRWGFRLAFPCCSGLEGHHSLNKHAPFFGG